MTLHRGIFGFGCIQLFLRFGVGCLLFFGVGALLRLLLQTFQQLFAADGQRLCQLDLVLQFHLFGVGAPDAVALLFGFGNVLLQRLHPLLQLVLLRLALGLHLGGAVRFCLQFLQLAAAGGLLLCQLDPGVAARELFL